MKSDFGNNHLSYLDRLTACTQFNRARILEFRIEGELIGFMAPEFADVLAELSDVFQIKNQRIPLFPRFWGLITEPKLSRKCLKF
jgi:hypothetical protein